MCDLPPLTGSEKQIKWASEIRQDCLKALASWDDVLAQAACLPELEASQFVYGKRMSLSWYADLYQYISVRFSREHNVFMKYEENRKISHKERLELCARFLKILRSITDSGWWIEHRDSSVQRIIFELQNELLAPPDRPLNSEQQEIIDSMTMRPENSVTKASASVVLNDHAVFTSMPVRCAEFRAALLPCSRFDKNSRCWVISSREANGDIRDRAAEQIHSLLSAGIPVFCANQAARETAVSASFKPLYPRWIMQGSPRFMRLRFEKDNELLQELEKIRQIVVSKNGRHTYLIHFDNWEIARYLQTEFGFRIESAVEERINEVRKIQSGQIVTVAGTAPVARPDIRDDAPTGKIDSELLDND